MRYLSKATIIGVIIQWRNYLCKWAQYIEKCLPKGTPILRELYLVFSSLPQKFDRN